MNEFEGHALHFLSEVMKLVVLSQVQLARVDVATKDRPFLQPHLPLETVPSKLGSFVATHW